MNTYKTKDFYLTALFLCNGFRLIGSEKSERAVYFEVEVKDEQLLKKLINDFINFDATVNLGKLVKITALLRRELDKHRR